MAHETWYDDAAGPLVRPYAITRGRTRSSRIELDLMTIVLAVGDRPADPRDGAQLEPEARRILELCAEPIAIAEIAAVLQIPLGVVKVLAGDLIESGQMIYRAGILPSPDVLQAVLEGIRRL